MKSFKVVTVIGTRPEIIRLSKVIQKFDKIFNHILINTGQNYNYELNDIFFKQLQIREPNYYLNAAKSNPTETISNIIVKVDKILRKEKPDAFLVLGDTNSALSAIAAKKLKIPIFHMEAGNRSFDQRVPEEINRKIVDHISDINIPYSDISRYYLIREGIDPKYIIKSGSPIYEVLMSYKSKINKSNILKKLNLKPKEFILVSIHREENVESKINLQKIINGLNEICQQYKLLLIISTHPRTKKAISKEKYYFNENIKFIEPVGYFDYNKLQLCAKFVISDSGTINEESSILRFPALNLRNSHERPEAMEEASTVFVGLEKEDILNGVKVLLDRNTNFNIPKDYEVKNVSDKIARIVMSYSGYVNREIWKKDLEN